MDVRNDRTLVKSNLYRTLHVGLESCRIGAIQFLVGWLKRRPEPGFSFIRFSFAYVSTIVFINCVGFVLLSLVVVIFVVLVPAK